MGAQTMLWLAKVRKPGTPAIRSLGNGDAAKRVTAWPLPIPNIPTIVGYSLYSQGMVFEPGANAFGAVVTNAGAMTIGF
jgi:hypothetical protein